LFEYFEKRKIYLIYIPLIIYWIFLFIVTSLPAPSVPSFEVGDKVKHFAAFFGLSVLLSLTLLYQNKNLLVKRYYLGATFIIASIYGFLDEFHQSFIPGRSSEFLDWVADSLGALVGILFIFYMVKKFNYIPAINSNVDI
jgi:VanZ family protein